MRTKEQEASSGVAGGGRSGQGGTKLHIFVNRRKFDELDGVQDVMTGRQIAALVGVPGDNAVVRRDTGPERTEVGIEERVEIDQADHFLVTRRTVEGGYEP